MNYKYAFNLLVTTLISCEVNLSDKKIITVDNIEPKTNKSFINSINYPELNTDSITIKPDKIGKLEFNLFERKNKSGFKVNFWGMSDTLEIYGETLEFYKEEDFNNDGVNEIGVLPGFGTSACRIYYLYNIYNGVWEKLAETQTHLPDREKGINYFSKKGEKLKILTASNECCCQCECYKQDTIVKVLRKS